MHIINQCILLLILSCNTAAMCSAHKIIYLIATPRSLSTAFTRMMYNRDDFLVMHEPSQYAFAKKYTPDFAKGFCRQDAFQTFDEVKNTILHKAQDKNVFIKEMAFMVHPFLTLDHALLLMPNVYFVFLTRHPHPTVLSMHNKMRMYTDLIPDAHQRTARLLGYDELYELINLVSKHACNKPYIIHAEDLYTHPAHTIELFCDYTNIPFSPEDLNWQPLSDTFNVQAEWHDAKNMEDIKLWHERAAMSTAFTQPTAYAVDSKGNPTFSEIENLEVRKLYQQIYNDQMVHYQSIKALSFFTLHLQ